MPYCFGIKNIELAVAQLALYDEVGPFYIYPLREGSDDCWDGFSWRGCDWRLEMSISFCTRTKPRLCAVWTGTADRDTLAHLGTEGN